MQLLDKRFFSELGPNVVNLYRKHTFDKGKDYEDKKFDKYSTKYGRAKRTGKLKRQSSRFKNTTSPVLTGDLYRDFKFIKAAKDSFSFGTVAHGAKVDNLEKLGRIIATSKRIPKHIEEFILKEAEEYVMNKMNKNFKNRSFDI